MPPRLICHKLPSGHFLTLHRIQSTSSFRLTIALSGKVCSVKMSTGAGTGTEDEQQHQHSPLKDRVQILAGQDNDDILSKLEALTAPPSASHSSPAWTLVLDGKGVQRSFRFKTFNKTWVYNSTKILWTTHNPEGLTIKDVDMAKYCDEQALLHDELTGTDAESAPSCRNPPSKGSVKVE